jgi:hypothetical protein
MRGATGRMPSRHCLFFKKNFVIFLKKNFRVIRVISVIRVLSFGKGHKKMDETGLGLKSSTLNSFKSFKNKIACKSNFPLSNFLFKTSMFLFTAVESRQTFKDAY